MAKSYYDILGISKNASVKEMKQVYRKLARKHHPDVNPGDKSAEAKFKEINEAYQVLSDPETRRKYDRFGENWEHADQYAKAASRSRTYQRPSEWQFGSVDLGEEGLGSGGSVFDRFFGGDLFGTRGRRPSRYQIDVEVTLEEAYAGTTRTVVIDGPSAPKRLEVKIPPGVDNGSKIKVPAREAREIILMVSIRPHDRFERKRQNLYMEAPIPLYNAILGGEVLVPTIDGNKVALKVPPETQNGRTFRISKKGMPKLGAKDNLGDLYVTLRVVLPSKLTEEENQKFRELKTIRP